MTYELRMTEGEPVTVSENRAVGYASVFNVRSQQIAQVRGIPVYEEITPTAFNKTIQEADVRALANHDPNMLLGRSKSGTLELRTDDHGLEYSVAMPDTQIGRDWALLMERGDIDGSSFGFIPVGKPALRHENGVLVRTVSELKLRDVGPVTFPAYLQASSGMQRSLQDQILTNLSELRGLDGETVDKLLLAQDLDELFGDSAQGRSEETTQTEIFHRRRR